MHRFTGGSSGLPWGTQGVWTEPYDSESARDTVDKLRHLGAAHAARGHAAIGAKPAEEEERVNAACEHEACSVYRFCIIDQLQHILDSYGSAGAEQFKRKHIKVRTSALERSAEMPLPGVAVELDRMKLYSSEVGMSRFIVVCDI